MASASLLRLPTSRWQRWLLLAVAVLALLALLVAFFPWDLLRGPVNRYVSQKTGRHFEITRRLDVKLGRDTRILLDGVVFANPDWARDRNLVEAERAELKVRLWPLILHRRVEMPVVFLSRPRLGLEMQPDGRRTWALEREGRGESTLVLGTLRVDQGSVHFVAPQYGADLKADFAIDVPGTAATSDAALPLSFRGGGRWRGQPFVAEGRTGDVLALRESLQRPFPLRVAATAGNTALQASGTVSNLASFDGADMDVHLRGRDLGELYRITGIVLPATPAYEVRGHLRRAGERWEATRLQGKLGRTDLAGALAYDTSGKVAQLSGELSSRLLDFDDMAPLVGMAPPPKTEQGKQAARRERKAGARVLPDTPLDLSRLAAMNADVRYAATRVVNVHQLPLERIASHVRLQDGVLQLDPLDAGVAGGRLAGTIRIDGRVRPVQGRIKLDAQALQLAKLFPAVDLNKASVGAVHGHIDLAGSGATTAQLLGSASGDVQLLMGRGRMSNLLLEFAGLDGGEIIKFLMGHDQRVELRCAAAAFDVKQGLMSTRALVLDTSDTVIYGQGTINLADERLDLLFRPQPKDVSILSVRSPLKLTGTLGAPKGGLEKGTLLARGAAALALGAINPLLALAATVETGPGKDADCTAVLKEAGSPRQAAAPAPAKRQQQARASAPVASSTASPAINQR